MHFRYTVKTAQGRLEKGVAEAGSAPALAQSFRAAGSLVIKLEPLNEQAALREGLPPRFHPAWLAGVRDIDAETGLRQMASMLRSGLSVLSALRMVGEQARCPRASVIWRRVEQMVANGGTLSSSVITEYESGSAHTFNLSGYVPTWGDRVFVGWAESANATSATVISGGSYSTSTLSSTLYAVWNTTYTVTYDTNGGTNTPSPQTYATTQSSHSFTIQSSSMIRAGYEFVGWGLTSNDTAATYQTGNTVNLTRAEPTITLYAVWARAESEVTLTVEPTTQFEGSEVTCS